MFARTPENGVLPRAGSVAARVQRVWVRGRGRRRAVVVTTPGRVRPARRSACGFRYRREEMSSRALIRRTSGSARRAMANPRNRRPRRARSSIPGCLENHDVPSPRTARTRSDSRLSVNVVAMPPCSSVFVASAWCSGCSGTTRAHVIPAQVRRRPGQGVAPRARPPSCVLWCGAFSRRQGNAGRALRLPHCSRVEAGSARPGSRRCGPDRDLAGPGLPLTRPAGRSTHGCRTRVADRSGRRRSRS